jgi:MerR family transcriptional regulator, light-induced transcriptional regulator
VVILQKKFNISVISKACGILPHTLRAWESRYKMFTPIRDESGNRVYTEQDLKKSVLLALLVGHGHSISSLSSYKISELENLGNSIETKESDKERNNGELNSKRLLNYLDRYQIELASKELQYLRQSTATKDFILNTILPMMREIGLKVSQGKYTITQEHIMSTIVRDQLSQIDLPNLNAKSTEIAIATPEGNLHELAITIANILCRSHKFTTRYLGAAHPAECLAEAINVLNSPLLVLGVVSSDYWVYTKKIIPYLAAIDKHLTTNIEVILGGGSQLKFPDFKYITKVIVMPTFQEFDDYLLNIY